MGERSKQKCQKQATSITYVNRTSKYETENESNETERGNKNNNNKKEQK